MSTQLNHMIARQRSAELQRAGEQARLAQRDGSAQPSRTRSCPLRRLLRRLRPTVPPRAAVAV